MVCELRHRLILGRGSAFTFIWCNNFVAEAPLEHRSGAFLSGILHNNFYQPSISYSTSLTETLC